MYDEQKLREFCREILWRHPYTTTGSIVGRAYYRDKTMYQRHDKAYAFVQKEREIILQNMKNAGYLK